MNHWRDPATSHPTNEPGFVRGFVFDSIEQPGTLRVLTLWEEPEQFDAYFASPGHQAIGGTMGQRSAASSSGAMPAWASSAPRATPCRSAAASTVPTQPIETVA